MPQNVLLRNAREEEGGIEVVEGKVDDFLGFYPFGVNIVEAF
jgi:hypothetical protein